MLLLVRHGESTANAQGVLLGRTDAPLTALGEAQGRALAAALGAVPVAALRTSPLARAVRTAEALRTGLVPVVDERWVEVDYGVFEGRPLTGVPDEVWRRWRTEPHYRPDGGETLHEVHRRVAEACEELFATAGAGARAEDADVVVVSHVSPIKAAVAWAMGAGHDLAFHLRLSTGSITRLGWGSAGPLLHTFNEVPPTP